jgi:hypothetical protein
LVRNARRDVREERGFNVKRLRREGKRKLGRADAREAWWTSPVAAEEAAPAV